MKHISILVPEGNCSLVNIEGTHQIFSEINAMLARAGKAPLFKVQLVGLRKETAMYRGLFHIHPDALFSEVTQTDLIIIPAIHGDKRKVIEDNKDFLPWIVSQYKGGTA